MEISGAQQEDISRILRKHPIGIKYTSIWDASTAFDEKIDLAKVIHRMIQLQLIYKKGDLHFLTGVDVPAANPEDKDPVKPPRQAPVSKKKLAVQIPEDADEDSDSDSDSDSDADEDDADDPDEAEERATKVSPTKPVVATKVQPAKPFANLRRTNGTGASALALYKCRAEQYPLNLDDLMAFTGTARAVLYQSMIKLVALGVVDKDDTLRNNVKFRWSGKFIYPFDRMEPRDDNMLRMSVKDWKAKLSKTGARFIDDAEETEAETETEPSTGEDKITALIAAGMGCSNPVPTLDTIPLDNSTRALWLIDHQIQTYESLIESLRRVRSALAPA